MTLQLSDRVWYALYYVTKQLYDRFCTQQFMTWLLLRASHNDNDSRENHVAITHPLVNTNTPI